MTLDQIDTDNMRLFLTRELRVNLIYGVLWGCAVAIFAYVFYTDEMLSLIMLFAMIITLLIAALAGILIPYFLDTIGRDPVMGSSVFLTAVTDSMGFFTLYSRYVSCLMVPESAFRDTDSIIIYRSL